MPVHKVKLPDGSTGYQWGRTGKIYKDPRKAYAQGAAIEHSGWKQKKATISQPASSSWYRCGICKVAGLHKQALWPWGSTAPKQGAPATTPGKPRFLGRFGNTFSNVGNKIKNIGTNLANLGEADHAWGALDYAVDFFRNPFGLRDNTMDQDTGLTYGQKKQIATGQGSLFQGTSQYNNAWRQFLVGDTQKRNAVRADIDNTIAGFRRPQPAPAQQPAPQPAPIPAAPQPAPQPVPQPAPTPQLASAAPQPAAPAGATAQQAPAPKPTPVAQPAVQTTQTAKQHADNIAKGNGNIMVDDQVDMVRDDYEQQLWRINNAIADIQNGKPNNDAIAATSGDLSPTRKIMDPDTYQNAKDPNNPETQAYLAQLQAQKAQVQKNMKRLGRSSAQVRQARANGSDAKARKSYADITQEANNFIRNQKQLQATKAKPGIIATMGRFLNAAQAKAQAQPTAATGTTTTQPATSSTATGTAIQSQNTGAQTSAAPKKSVQRPTGTARGSIFKTYDTTSATGHASYTRNGITYLKYDNAAQAQAALGTNNVMAFTAKDGSRYWAPVRAKGAKPVGSYASTPGTTNNTLHKSPNIMRPSGMSGSKNGSRSAT